MGQLLGPAQVRYYKSGKVYEEGNITDEYIWKDGECVEICEGDD